MKVIVIQSCLTLCDNMGCSPWNSPGQNTGGGSLSLLQGIFLTQGLNPGLPNWGQILYQLSHREAQEYWNGWLIPSPVDLPDPRNWTRISCTASGFFTNWVIREVFVCVCVCVVEDRSAVSFWCMWISGFPISFIEDIVLYLLSILSSLAIY